MDEQFLSDLEKTLNGAGIPAAADGRILHVCGVPFVVTRFTRNWVEFLFHKYYWREPNGFDMERAAKAVVRDLPRQIRLKDEKDAQRRMEANVLEMVRMVKPEATSATVWNRVLDGTQIYCTSDAKVVLRFETTEVGAIAALIDLIQEHGLDGRT